MGASRDTVRGQEEKAVVRDADKEAMSKGNDIIVIDDEEEAEKNDVNYDEYDGHFGGNPRDTPDTSVDLKRKEDGGVVENELETNNDFIAFSESSDDEVPTEEEKPAVTSKTDYPWIVDHDHSKEEEIADWLTLEMRDFVSYISPNKEEIESRNNTISAIRNAVKQLWDDADLHVFGSYSTDLYLPGSDIDCVVNSKNGDKESRSNLYKLANYLREENLATEIEVIAKARVPIIKFVEPESGIHIDVSFERINGLEAAKLIRSWLDATPGLRELVLIIKQFLHSRRLNNVHTGGLGGFSIICLVYAFLKLHPRVMSGEIDPRDNLGVLLIDFFELYGKNFGYDHVAIAVTASHAAYIPKEDWHELHPIKNSFALAIQDPGDGSNNISRGSFNLRDIKKAFAGAFDLLVNRCFELQTASFKERFHKSILGHVIKYHGKVRDFKDERGLVVNKAIIENENYHKKRSRIVYDNDDDNDDDSNYIPPKIISEGSSTKKKHKRGLAKRRDLGLKRPKMTADLYDDESDGYNPMKS